MIATTGGRLYPPADALIGSNYPPLSFYVVGWIGRLLGDFVVAGRLLSVVSFLAAAGLVFVAARRIAPESRAPRYAALLFLLYGVTLFRSYFDLDDPQWFAHAIELGALVTLLPRDPTVAPTPRGVVVAAALFVLAGFVKQNLVGLPIAVTIWLAVVDRRALNAWLASAFILVCLGFAACYALYGAPFFRDVLLSPRSFSTERAVAKSAPVLLAMAPMIVATFSLAGRAREDFRVRLVIFGAIACLVTGLIERSGAGVDINAHFETLIVLAIGSGAALASRLDRARVLLWLFMPFVVLLPLEGAKAYRGIANVNRDLTAWKAMETHIRSVPGPVACENLAFCYWAGKGYEVDFFLDDQKILSGGGTRVLSEVLGGHAVQAAEIRMPSAGSARGADPLSARLYADREEVLYRRGDRVLVSLR